MKPPLWRLQRATYPVSFHIQTRYRDEDSLNHINNMAIAGYYDEVRSRFMRQIFDDLGPAPWVRIVTADTRVSFLGEVFHPDMVEIASGITRIGTASMDIGQALFQKGKCAGLCVTTFVQADETGSSPLSPGLRAVLETYRIHEPAAS
jgi:acyl-CoA thioester hydrolase